MLDDRMFILAGKAIFTVDNGKGQHYTFKVSAPPADSTLAAMDNYFVSVLTGPDNTKDYSYLGLFDAHFCELRSTKNSKFREDSQSFQVAAVILKIVWSGRKLPQGYTLNHEGLCGRCGRKLTVPESIESGIGPECAEIMGVSWERKPRKASSHAVTPARIFPGNN